MPDVYLNFGGAVRVTVNADPEDNEAWPAAVGDAWARVSPAERSACATLESHVLVDVEAAVRDTLVKHGCVIDDEGQVLSRPPAEDIAAAVRDTLMQHGCLINEEAYERIEDLVKFVLEHVRGVEAMTDEEEET